MLLLEALSMHGTVVILAICLSVPTELTDVSYSFQVFIVVGHFICFCFILFFPRGGGSMKSAHLISGPLTQCTCL